MPDGFTADVTGAQKVAVVGVGAIGGVLADAAQAAGHEVTLYTRTPFDGLSVERDGSVHDVKARVVTDLHEVTAADWVLLATKANQTAGAAGWLTRLAGPTTTVVVVQNGVEHRARLAPLGLPGRVVPALTYIGAHRTEPGQVIHVSGRKVIVPDDAAGVAFAALLDPRVADVERVPDFLTAAWRKLLTNAGANPLTALTGRPISVLCSPGMRTLARGLLTEVAAVGRAAGARLTDADVAATMDYYRGLPPETRPSMLQDRLAGRPTEVDEITGVVVRTAEAHGIDVPLNRAMFALLAAA